MVSLYGAMSSRRRGLILLVQREGELRSILAKQPLSIVHRTDLWPKELERFKGVLDVELRDHYELVQTIDIHYEIYARRSETGGQGR
jgi:hypothetical protein